MRYFSVALLCLMAFCLTACAKRAQQRQWNNERTAIELQSDMVDLNQRLVDMEQRMTTVNNELSVLRNQPYPVKTTKGAKTNYVANAPGMPVPPPQPSLMPPAFDPRAAGTPVPLSDMGAAPPASPRVHNGQSPSASSPVPTPVAAPPPQQQQGDGWLSSYVAPSPSSSRGTGAKAVPAPTVQGPRTLIPQDQPQAAPALQTKRQAGVNELALPPETPAAAYQQAATASPAPVPTPQAANPPAPRGGKQPPVSMSQNLSGQSGEEVMYNKALAEFNASRYSQAAAGFTELMYTYPSGRYAPNAGYWLGESLYGQNQYSDALAQFKEVTSRFPQHQKASDALFKAGLCYMRLGDKENAALQFRSLVTDYPNSPAANLARQRGFTR